MDSGPLSNDWIMKTHLEKHKVMNKLHRIKNGNRKENFKVIQWNAGSKLWKNKLMEMEDLLNDQRPHLCFITEANLWDGADPHNMEIPGHYLVLSNTMKKLNHARKILIVREGVGQGCVWKK